MKLKLRTRLFGKMYYYEDLVPKSIDLNFYYPMEVGCTNCGNKYKVYLRKGRYVKDIQGVIKCKNCKCALKDCKCSVCS
jgi:hypothetical protein